MMNGKTSEEGELAVTRIAALRLAVGLLGEREGAGWWTSAFLSPTSTSFLSPVFGGNTLQSRYQGVLEAAKRVHDERIGVGHVFHLFRLPESIEQRLFESIQSGGVSDLAITISSPESAKATLQSSVTKAIVAKSGPALMALPEAIETAGWISEAASLYSAAFGAGVQCFPYFPGDR
jgi:hypothetical protein